MSPTAGGSAAAPEAVAPPKREVPPRAERGWPPVVVASVFQTGLNLMRDLIARGVEVVGVDCEPAHEGFRSVYGRSLRCPNPDDEPDAWLACMLSLARTMPARPVLIPAADIFVTALGRHAVALEGAFRFSRSGVVTQARLATKEEQYPLAAAHGFPMPPSANVSSEQDVAAFVGAARFPCLLKPRHQREWEALPVGHALRGHKLVTAERPDELIEAYRTVAPHRADAVVQEVVVGPDSNKYCYLAVYGEGSQRLGYCVVREYRAFPLLFGSASVVRPVEDEEIERTCDAFLRALGYVGLCEIEVKRDERDGSLRLIEVNPRFSVTGDAAKYAGVPVGWLHYLDRIGLRTQPVRPTRFDVSHVTLRRDLAIVPDYLHRRMGSWRDVLGAYRPPVAFFDFDARDWRVTASTMATALRRGAGATARVVRARRRTRARPSP